ncbi:nucleoside triphosphate pyrophosphohydrolase [Thorsellia anophelis]|uniref:Nucleoside triphosphate pyrophosphohydrolase n=1 Tax=Thorsellia anophelis DSM 18579 TaxID=1123402 RepID=A0A1I0CMR9_9GAMM|nr:nucleoside triphosphate pyrophosphohydrolase [Thorsellia anophelis]SET20785.1 ATP diphosphatase [Thorsellia anophelis DSM 18579]
MIQNNSQSHTIETLRQIMVQLRDKDKGCPWDIKQTFKSLIGCTLEEAYEVKEAIETSNYLALKEELGDLLFQIIFYAELGNEQGMFDFDSICHTICEKLIRRHPHVFGELANKELKNQTSDEMQIKQNWEMIKQEERNNKSFTSRMDDIPQALPALLRAHKIQKRCQSVGFDWDNLDDVFDKVEEEILEVKETLINKKPTEKTEEELGDLLFALVNLTRHLGYNPELTLDKANQKFMRRFRLVETYLANSGVNCQQATLEQMESAWIHVKKNESS